VFAGLQLTWQATDNTGWHRGFIEHCIVDPAAAVAHALTPELPIHAAGNYLRTARGGLNIVNGCDGTETLFLLVAALAAARLSLAARALGLCYGAAAVFGLNLLRILALFYSLQSSMRLFDVMHGIVTPVLMVACTAAFYYVWLHRHPPAP